MATDILAMFDEESDQFDPEIAPTPDPRYPSKREPFDFEGVIERARFKRSQNPETPNAVYLIAEVKVEAGQGTNSDGDLIEPGDVITLMHNLAPRKKTAIKHVYREVRNLISASLGEKDDMVGDMLNTAAAATAKTKTALAEIVGDEAMDFAVKEGSEHKLRGLYRLVCDGLLDGSKIRAATVGDANDAGWYQYRVSPVEPANTLEDVKEKYGIEG